MRWDGVAWRVDSRCRAALNSAHPPPLSLYSALALTALPSPSSFRPCSLSCLLALCLLEARHHLQYIYNCTTPTRSVCPFMSAAPAHNRRHDLCNLFNLQPRPPPHNHYCTFIMLTGTHHSGRDALYLFEAVLSVCIWIRKHTYIHMHTEGTNVHEDKRQ